MLEIHRTYYRCEHCNISVYPDDEVLEISRSIVSKGYAKICSQMIIAMPFEQVSHLLYNIYGFEVSETCLKDISNNIGTKLYKEAEQRGKLPFRGMKEKVRCDILYVHADGSMVPTISENCIEYKENKLGLLYTDRDIVYKKTRSGKERVTINNKRFVNSIGEGVEPFKKLLYSCAVDKGCHSAKKVIVLTDGATWLKKMKDEYFPYALHILDWYHVVDHLWATAHALYGEDNHEQCKQWVTPLKDLLWKGKVEKVIAILSEEGLKAKKYQTALIQLRGYFVSNKDCMSYNEYRKKGYFIGSGAVESANKYIVADRMKRSGMRWSLQHANALIWLRCKYYEDQWDEFWENLKLPEYMNHNYITHTMVA